MKMIIFNAFFKQSCLTISLGEMFGNFILFEGKILKFKQKVRDALKIGRSGHRGTMGVPPKIERLHLGVDSIIPDTAPDNMG